MPLQYFGFQHVFTPGPNRCKVNPTAHNPQNSRVLQGSCLFIHLSLRKELLKQQPEIAPSYKVWSHLLPLPHTPPDSSMIGTKSVSTGKDASYKTGVSGEEGKEVLSTTGILHQKSFNMLFLGLMLIKFKSVIHQSSTSFHSKYSISEESKSAGCPLRLILYTRPRQNQTILFANTGDFSPLKHSILPKQTFKASKTWRSCIMDILGKIQTLPKHHCVSACSYRKGTKTFMSSNRRSSRGDAQRNKTRGHMKTQPPPIQAFKDMPTTLSSAIQGN